jgi:hypothetical protein
MSEAGQGQQQEKQHPNIESNNDNLISVGSNLVDTTTSGVLNRRPRVGVLLLQAYEQHQGKQDQQQRHKGTSVAPQKILLEWTKKLVSFHILTFCC